MHVSGFIPTGPLTAHKTTNILSDSLLAHGGAGERGPVVEYHDLPVTDFDLGDQVGATDG